MGRQPGIGLHRDSCIYSSRWTPTFHLAIEKIQHPLLKFGKHAALTVVWVTVYPIKADIPSATVLFT